MAKRHEEEPKKGLDEWMATYSDMVTLLMCFFVLLYAGTTPDETKWQYIFQSFNTTGTYLNPFVMDEQPNSDKAASDDGNSEVPPPADGKDDGSNSSTPASETPAEFADLSAWFQSTVSDNGLEGSISISSSATRIYIRFDNAIMFDGDSAVLKQTGKDAIHSLLPGIKAVNKYIKTIHVSGHTSKGVSTNVNDWDLSAARACSVTKYMDFSRAVESNKFIPEGRGPYDPINLDDTDEGKAKNRRVELVIVRNDIAIEDTEIQKDILKYDYGIGHKVTDPEDRVDPNKDYTDNAIDQIISGLDDKYGSNIADSSTDFEDLFGPNADIPIKEIPDDVLLPETVVETEAEKDIVDDAATPTV